MSGQYIKNLFIKKTRGEISDRVIGTILAVALIITFLAVLIYVMKRALG